MNTTYLKAIMEVYRKTFTGPRPTMDHISGYLPMNTTFMDKCTIFKHSLNLAFLN